MAAKQKVPRLIGVIHLPALPGAPGVGSLSARAALDRAGHQALVEMRLLERAGFDGLILENFGDVPFYGAAVPPETVSAVAILAAGLREATRLPLGINILRNDSRAGLAVAAVSGAQWVRVNVLSGVAASDQGWLIGGAAELLRERARLGASVQIWADVHVKHAQTLSSEDPLQALDDTVQRGGADAVIVSGAGTGKPADPARVKLAHTRAKALGVPLYVGSGVTIERAAEWRKLADGVIVSSCLREGGRAGKKLEAARVRAFVRAFRAR